MVFAQSLMPLAWTDDRLAALQPSVDANPFGPLGSGLDVFNGSRLHELNVDGVRALVAVRPVPLAHGTRLDVTGLVSLGRRIPAQLFSDFTDSLAGQYGASLVALCTQRPHVIRQAARTGYEISGVIMNKWVPHVRQ